MLLHRLHFLIICSVSRWIVHSGNTYCHLATISAALCAFLFLAGLSLSLFSIRCFAIPSISIAHIVDRGKTISANAVAMATLEWKHVQQQQQKQQQDTNNQTRPGCEFLLGANINFMFVNFFYFELDYFTRICINSKAFHSSNKCGKKRGKNREKTGGKPAPNNGQRNCVKFIVCKGSKWKL